MRRPVASQTKVTFHPVVDRDLFDVGPNGTVWMYPHMIKPVEPGTIVWLKPPITAHPDLIAETVNRLKDQGAIVKLIRADRVDAVVVKERTEETKPVLTQADTRTVVYEVVRELTARTGVPYDDVIKVVEQSFDAAGF